MSAARHHASGSLALFARGRTKRGPGAAVLLAAALVLVLSCDVTLACDPLLSGRSGLQHDLDLAEEHRGWVELWMGLDDREARLELSLFIARIRHVAQGLAGDPCLDRLDDDILRSRIRHEQAWFERKARLLGDKVKMIRAGP